MTTNQTIDGVPLLPCPFCGGEPYGTHDHYVHDDLSPMPCVECRSCSAHLKAEDWNRRVKPAAQPQGEPVAMVRTHGSECWEDITGESLEMCKAEPEEYEVRMLYARPAEQPAPVADSTTSDKYKAELYDEVWQKARDMGFGNVTDALAEMEKRPAPVAMVFPERLDFPHRDEFESADQYAAAVGEAKKWNACLDEVARLNQAAKPVCCGSCPGGCIIGAKP